MAHIVETVLADRRISLGNEEYFRQISCGANWGKLRIGIRFAINGRNDIQNPAYLQLGLGADANSYFSADRPTGYIGARFGGSADNHPDILINFAQANNSYYSFGSTELTTIVKDASGVLTQGTRLSTGGTYFAVANSPTATEHEFFATFTRGGNGYTLNDAWFPTSAAAVQAGKTFAQFQIDMNNETGTQPVLSNVTRDSANFGPIAFGPTITFPPVSYVSVYWSKSTPTIEIANIQVSKFY